MLARRNTVRLIRTTLSAGEAARDHHDSSFPASTGALARELRAKDAAGSSPPTVDIDGCEGLRGFLWKILPDAACDWLIFSDIGLSPLVAALRALQPSRQQ